MTSQNYTNDRLTVPVPAGRPADDTRNLPFWLLQTSFFPTPKGAGQVTGRDEGGSE